MSLKLWNRAILMSNKYHGSIEPWYLCIFRGSYSLSRKFNYASFSNHVYLDFTRIVEFIFYTQSHIAGKFGCFKIGDFSWGNKYTNFASCLKCIGFLNPFE